MTTVDILAYGGNAGSSSGQKDGPAAVLGFQGETGQNIGRSMNPCQYEQPAAVLELFITRTPLQQCTEAQSARHPLQAPCCTLGNVCMEVPRHQMASSLSSVLLIHPRGNNAKERLHAMALA